MLLELLLQVQLIQVVVEEEVVSFGRGGSGGSGIIIVRAPGPAGPLIHYHQELIQKQHYQHQLVVVL
jgi:hypothetical protein